MAEQLHVQAHDRDLAEHALHRLSLDGHERRNLEDSARVADGDVERLSGRERLRAQEVDGGEDVLRRPFEGGGDDTRGLLRVVRVALGVLNPLRVLVEDGLARPHALTLLVHLVRAQHVEGVRLDLRLDVVAEVDAEQFMEPALRFHVRRQHERLRRRLAVARRLRAGDRPRRAVSLEPQLGDVNAAQEQFRELAVVDELLRGHEGHGRRDVRLCMLSRRVFGERDRREYNREKERRRYSLPEKSRWHSENPAFTEFVLVRRPELPSAPARPMPRAGRAPRGTRDSAGKGSGRTSRSCPRRPCKA